MSSNPREREKILGLAQGKTKTSRSTNAKEEWSLKMIGTSVDTRAFSEIVSDERFRVEPPQNSSLLINDTVDITRSGAGTSVRITDLELTDKLPSVERKLDEMIERCSVSVAKYPSSPRAHMNLGLALMRGGRTDDGIAQLRIATSLDENDYVATGSLAAAYFNSGDLDAAADLYTQIIQRFANSVAGHMGLASVAMRKNDLKLASNCLQQALQIDPNLANASFLLAVVHFKLNDPQRAISVLRKALRDNSRSPELNQGLAVAYLLAGELNRAERSFQTALALDPNLSGAARGLASVWLQQNRSDEVIDMLSRYLEQHSEDCESRELVAQALVGKSQFRQARNHLMAIVSQLMSLPIKDVDKIARLNNNIGYCLAQEGNYKEAESKIQEAIQTSTKLGPLAYENLARVYVLQGRFERALSFIEESINRGHRSSSLILLREACLVNLDRFEDAISEMLRLISEKEAPMEAYAELGWLFCEWREDFKAAIAVLNAGLDKWSDSALILNNLAYAHIMNDELTAANALLGRLCTSSATLA